MPTIVVVGHGGYAAGVQSNLEMLAGTTDGFYFVDLTRDDDTTSFERKVRELANTIDEPLLFACDFYGASPFKLAARICVERSDGSEAVSGLNPAAYIELKMRLRKVQEVEGLSELAITTAKAAIRRFSPAEK